MSLKEPHKEGVPEVNLLFFGRGGAIGTAEGSGELSALVRGWTSIAGRHRWKGVRSYIYRLASEASLPPNAHPKKHSRPRP